MKESKAKQILESPWMYSKGEIDEAAICLKGKIIIHIKSAALGPTTEMVNQIVKI